MVRNSALEIEWYQKSANQGYAIAQCNLANNYAKGTGVPQNNTLAAQWYQKAADNGHIEAMVKLADCYHWGYSNEDNQERES